MCWFLGDFNSTSAAAVALLSSATTTRSLELLGAAATTTAKRSGAAVASRRSRGAGGAGAGAGTLGCTGGVRYYRKLRATLGRIRTALPRPVVRVSVSKPKATTTPVAPRSSSPTKAQLPSRDTRLLLRAIRTRVASRILKELPTPKRTRESPPPVTFPTDVDKRRPVGKRAWGKTRLVRRLSAQSPVWLDDFYGKGVELRAKKIRKNFPIRYHKSTGRQVSKSGEDFEVFHKAISQSTAPAGIDRRSLQLRRLAGLRITQRRLVSPEHEQEEASSSSLSSFRPRKSAQNDRSAPGQIRQIKGVSLSRNILRLEQEQKGSLLDLKSAEQNNILPGGVDTEKLIKELESIKLTTIVTKQISTGPTYGFQKNTQTENAAIVRKKPLAEPKRARTVAQKVRGVIHTDAKMLPQKGAKSIQPSATGVAREKFHFQILTTPTSDTEGTTLLLHFDNKRYFFGNISEGTQRVCTQRGIGFKKLRNIFLTGCTSWKSTGGLIGMILSVADLQGKDTSGSSTPHSKESPGSPRVDIYGGTKLMHSIACARTFVFRKGVPITATEFEEDPEKPVDEPDWADEHIQVWAMPISGSALWKDLEIGSDSSKSSPTASPQSPRKRIFDEFQELESVPRPTLLKPEDQDVRRKVIKDMFESDWRFDNLVEVNMSDISNPASITMFIRDPQKRKLTRYRFPGPGDPPAPPGFKVLIRTPWPASVHGPLPPATTAGPLSTMCYIVRGRPQRGAFDFQKAIELGIPKGPKFGFLTKGQSITLQDGRVIAPEMVLGPKRPGKGIAIFDLPSLRYVEGLLDRRELQSPQVMEGVEVICWILGPGVVLDPQLQSYIKSNAHIKHIISSRDVCPDYLAMESSAASAIRLSRISKDHFPVPVHNNVAVPQDPSSSFPEELKGSFQPAQRGLTIELDPKVKIEEDPTASFLDTVKAIKDIPTEVHNLSRMAREKISKDKANGRKATLPSREPNSPAPSYSDHEIITIGTGSALPSKYRNVSATLLRIPGYGNFLFDCGENTLGQLSRIFEPRELEDVLRNLRFIWISHMHADHHLGTVPVLLRRNAICDADEKLRNKKPTPLYLASDAEIKKFIHDYNSVERARHVRFLICDPKLGLLASPYASGQKFDLKWSGLNIRSIRTCGVNHCVNAQAISITFQNGFKFSYSGDCRPSIDFAEIGKGSDVLVHEATFEDDMGGDALAKKHCTTAEALLVASIMEAKNVILTHFSQRYQKIPNMSNIKVPERLSLDTEMEASDEGMLPAVESDRVQMDDQEKSTKDDKQENETTRSTQETVPAQGLSLQGMNVCVAFDYMRLRVPDIKYMHEFTPAIMALLEAQNKETVDAGFTEEERVKMINRKQKVKKANVLAGTADLAPQLGENTKKKAVTLKDENLGHRREELADWIRSKQEESRTSQAPPAVEHAE